MEAIQTLAGGIAHDFNNLLAAIMGNVELAMDDVAADSDVLHNLEQIFKASRRGKDLVKQILLFSRRDQRESVLVEAGPLVTETMNLLRSSIPAAIDIRRHVEPGRSTVLADAGRLQQILMNLVSNAVHAMQEKGGVLDVVVREYQLTDDNASLPHLLPGAYLMIGVSDSGHGMSQGVMERIFEPFFTTKRPGEGPGMGLAVVHGIVKALKGAVAVSSELGKGSTFAVYLPIATSETERTVKEESRPLPRGEERILFVDDEKPIIEMNSALLERLGYHVNAVGNSAEALDLFTAAPDAFDLVITDQSMPDLTGIELVEENKVRPQAYPHHHDYRLQRNDRRGTGKEDGHSAVPHEACYTAGACRGHKECARRTFDEQVVSYFFMIMARPASPAFIMERRELLSRVILAAMASPYCGL